LIVSHEIVTLECPKRTSKILDISAPREKHRDVPLPR
jgi:hypothetical protein